MKKKFFQTLFLFFMILTLPFSTNMTGMQVQAAEEQTGIENPTYTLNTIDGTSVSTKANPNQTTMLVLEKQHVAKLPPHCATLLPAIGLETLIYAWSL